METSPAHAGYTEDERQAIEAQLERLLANPFFSHSRRFPAFLRYVVDKTLSGNTEQLKERTLGIEIFGKGPDYDTATDPIVRVTAAEIRKRIALYYQEPGHRQELRLSLPPGSYVPQFHLSDTENAESPMGASPSPELNIFPQVHRRWPRTIAAVIFLIFVVAVALLTWHHQRRSPIDAFWGPTLGSGDPILFCIADQTGYKSITLRDAADPTHAVILQDTVTAIVIDDLSTITKIAGMMQTMGHNYSLRGASETTLMDLRNGPSIVIGAFDNSWTLRFVRPLRFHFSNDPAMTRFSIIDASQPGRTPWTVDRALQLATNNYRDFAIVARFTDNTTGKPTIVAAGIGRGGTIAAGEFLTRPDLLRSVLRQQPAGTQNIEVVLSTQIINGEPGTPTVEAMHFW